MGFLSKILGFTISEKEYNKALQIIAAYKIQHNDKCCNNSCSCKANCCSCKKIKEGCSVKFTEEAHKQIGSSADYKVHIVKEIRERSDSNPLVTFYDGEATDISWIEHI